MLMPPPLFRSAVALIALLCAAPVLAAPSPAVPDDENYVAATRHLKAGRWFERAAVQLEKAVAANPNDYRAHLALGCAYASRMAAISYAATFANTLSVEQADYPELLADWEKAQKDPDSDEYGDPKPEPPPARLVFRTKDDDKPFTLTTAQAAARIKTLSRRARAEWTTALACAQTPAERAEVSHTQGWGLRVLQRYAKIADLNNPDEEEEEEEPDEDAPAPPPVPADPDVPTDKEIVAAFTQATEEAPNNAVYWQSLGDALKDETASKAAYLKSLEIAPRNAGLWYRLFLRAGDKVAYNANLSDPAVRSDRDTALDYLRRAANVDPANAFADYWLAYFRFKETRFGMIYGASPSKRDQALDDEATAATNADRQAARDAVAHIERGNRKARFAQPVYQPAVPVWLNVAWNYSPDQEKSLFLFQVRARELARATSGYALVAARRGNIGEGERTTRAVIGMGLKLVADWPTKDKTRDGGEMVLSSVGRALAQIGHTAHVEMYRRVGDAKGVARAQADFDAFKRREQAYGVTIESLVSRPIYNDY